MAYTSNTRTKKDIVGKKIQSLVNTEEEHLASVSVSVSVSRKRMEKKTKLTERIEQDIYEIENVATDTNMAATVTQNNENDNKNVACSDANTNTKKKSRSKKSRKGIDYDTQNISVKSSFSKFDALEKRNLIHVRSSDTGKAQEIFSNPQDDQQTNCRLCAKPVYKMEEIKAEKAIYHKNCFRCHECGKQLKVDNFQSHLGTLYCIVHFKLLFAPKYVEDTEPVKPRKAELIIRESQPVELPPDVVRASAKQDLGLEELHQLNVRSRFQVFENAAHFKSESDVPRHHQIDIKSSASIVSKLAKFQQCGTTDNTKIATSNEKDGEEQNSESSDQESEADIDLVHSKKRTERERPVGLGDAMNDIKNIFENGPVQTKEERREERKQEIQNIRSRLFMGKQAKFKEMYQQAVAESELGITSVGKVPDVEIGKAARTIKERFEKGEMFNDKNSGANLDNLPDDADVFESAISKKSRSIFMELDANIASSRNDETTGVNCLPKFDQQKTRYSISNLQNSQTEQENVSSVNQSTIANVVKYDEKPEDVKIATAELSKKFKFFETYRPTESEKPKFRMTPPRDGVVKMPTPESDVDVTNRKTSVTDNILEKTQTTSTVLNKFREMENNKLSSVNVGPRPLKSFTPPPDDSRRLYSEQNSEGDASNSDLSEEDVGSEAEDEGQINRWKTAATDQALKEAQAAARAKQLRAKFEKWEAHEIQREQKEGCVDIYSQQALDDSTIESTKVIRERFENMKNFDGKSPRAPRCQINREIVRSLSYWLI